MFQDSSSAPVKEIPFESTKNDVMDMEYSIRYSVQRKLNKVLVIESDVKVLLDLKNILEADQFEVIWATNGEDGIQFYKSFKPDLIICNIKLPVIDGYDVCKCIHTLEKKLPIPLIFLAEKPTYHEFRRAMELGADDYICRPYDAGCILDAIQRLNNKYKNIRNTIEITVPSSPKHEANENIIIRYRGKIIPISVNKILFISVEGQYSKILVEENKQYINKKALCKWEQTLPQNIFIRIHRATLVNINKIKEVRKVNNNIYKVYLHNSDQILELTRRYFKNLKKYTLKS